MSRYYNRAGEPIDLFAYEQLSSSDEYRRVDVTEIGDVMVSTVWLGLDHGFGAFGPLIFETMVFGGPLDGEQERYTTEAGARVGHQAMVDRVKAARS